jgi:hypothetical protein
MKPTFEKIVEEIFAPKFDCEIKLCKGDTEITVDSAVRAIDRNIKAAKNLLAKKYPKINMKAALFSQMNGYIIMFITVAISNMPYYYSSRWDIFTEDGKPHDTMKQYKPKK